MSAYQTTCGICDSERISFAWTDQHGVAQCFVCGTPYRLLHYDDNHQRIDKAPACLVDREYVHKLRTYWATFKRHIPSGCSFPGGQEMATPEEHKLFYDWLRSQDTDTAATEHE